MTFERPANSDDLPLIAVASVPSIRWNADFGAFLNQFALHGGPARAIPNSHGLISEAKRAADRGI